MAVKTIYFSGFSIDCLVIPFESTGRYNNQYLYEWTLEHGLLTCMGPNNISANDLIDSDGNTWHFRITSNVLYLDLIKDGVTLLTKTLTSPLPNGYRLGTNELYGRVVYLSYSNEGLKYGIITTRGDYSRNNNMNAHGIGGVTTCYHPDNLHDFPTEGNWRAGTNIQTVYTYEVSSHPSLKNCNISNTADIYAASKIDYYQRTDSSSFTNTYTDLFTPTEIRQYLPNTFRIEGGLITECTITLPRHTYLYTGSAVTPLPTIISISGNTLIKDVDYTLSYLDNIQLGTAQVVITGIYPWTSEARLYFQIVSNSDPLSGGGISTTGGGTGDFDDTSDVIAVPAVPTLSSLGSKFITIWTPTLAQLQNFATWLWTNTGLVDTLIKIYTNPIDYILGLHIVPVNISYADYVVNIGNVSSGITMRRALTQYVPVDCGSITVSEYWGAYLDYSPYTKLQLYLPFIGFIQIDADTVMGRTLAVKYNCDILSGSCVAFVTVDGTIAYTYTGNIAAQIPITNNDMSRIVSGMLTGIGSGVGLGLKAATATAAAGPASIAAGVAAGAAAAVATGVVASKQQVGRSGSISSIAGYLGYKKPFLAINRPRQALPADQNKFTGYPGFINEQLQNVLGFTKVEEIHLDHIPAMETELDEILEILQSGFIV